MTWKDRLRQMTLAGGALSLAACGVLGEGPIPCGNANPDPCICGRPDDNPDDRAACTAKKSCEATGGVWIAYAVSDPATRTTVPPHCEHDAGVDGASVTDMASDAASD